MTIATFMILDQLQIAETIVTITYAGLIGAIALGTALAFGLGGRDAAAARLLDGAVVRGEGLSARQSRTSSREPIALVPRWKERRNDEQDDTTVNRVCGSEALGTISLPGSVPVEIGVTEDG